jgi:Na+-driven multidrug efflux pump
MMIGNACIRATGNTRFVSRMVTLLAAINIVLDPFLIFGWGPAPALGFPGAAVTHLVANVVTCVATLYVLAFRRHLLRAPVLHTGMTESWKRILQIAVPSVISGQIGPISAAIITSLASNFGTDAVAALGVATRLENIATLVFYATSTGVAIFVGQNFGAGNHGRIREAVVVGSRVAIAWGLFVAAVLWIFADAIPPLFGSTALVAAYTAQYLRWVPLSYGAMGTMVISNAALNGMARPVRATLLILLKAVLIYIPLAYVLQKYFGFCGILAALATTNFAVGLISYLWNRRIVS